MVFVYEKSLVIIMFVYSLSFSMLGRQFVLEDVFHTQITNFQGQPMKNILINGVGTTTLNSIEVNATCSTAQCHANTVNPVTYLAVAAQYAWDIFLLISGLYIFNFIAQLGVPLIFMSGFIALYLFLLVRTMIGWVRGI